jgi:purine-binding chemotaxis protein CheW
LAPATLPGIINLRGQILTTIDLKYRLNLAVSEATARPMMMVVRTSEGPVNLVVDRIGSVLDVDASLFEKPTETLKPAIHAVTTHVCKLEKNLLLVLDTERVIQLPETNGERRRRRACRRCPPICVNWLDASSWRRTYKETMLERRAKQTRTSLGQK